jgi:hypothetical protein
VGLLALAQGRPWLKSPIFDGVRKFHNVMRLPEYMFKSEDNVYLTSRFCSIELALILNSKMVS